jgi:hypothetical protein
MSEISPSPPSARWLAPGMLLLGSVCFVLIWILLSLYLDRPCGWMAVLGALDAALMLRFGGMRGGALRAICAVVATLSIMLLVNWGVAATQIGVAMGLNPWESALKLGLDYAWTLAGLANHRLDLLWMALALPVAALAAR